MENSSPPRYISGLPLRLQTTFVRCFPRKYFAFLRHAVQDKYCSHPLLLRKSLQGITVPPLPEGYRVSRIGEAELARMLAHPEASPVPVYRNRLAKGDVCYCMTVNDEIVNFQWLSTSQCGVLRGFDRGVDFFSMAQHQFYTYDFYTYRNQRKLGYGTILKNQVLADMASRGFNEVLSCVMYDNHESLRIHMKMNYSLLALPCNFRLMDWQWTRWGSPEDVKEARQWLERFTSDLTNRKR